MARSRLKIAIMLVIGLGAQHAGAQPYVFPKQYLEQTFNRHVKTLPKFVDRLRVAINVACGIESCGFGWLVKRTAACFNAEVNPKEALFLKRFFDDKNKQLREAALRAAAEDPHFMTELQGVCAILPKGFSSHEFKLALHKWNVAYLGFPAEITMEQIGERVLEKGYNGAYLIPDERYFTAAGFIMLATHLYFQDALR